MIAVKEKFTLDDLELGQVVKFRNGNLAMVCKSKNAGVCLSGEEEWCPLYNSYNDDLTRKGLLTVDIMEVYDISNNNCYAWKINLEDRTLLWKREEDDEKLDDEDNEEVEDDFIEIFNKDLDDLIKFCTNGTMSLDDLFKDEDREDREDGEEDKEQSFEEVVEDLEKVLSVMKTLSELFEKYCV